MRMDLGGLFALVAPMMEQMLAQIVRGLPADAMPGYDVAIGWARTAMASSERLDLGVSFWGKGEVELRYTFVAVEGSDLHMRQVPADVPLATLAGWLDGERYPFQMLLRTDPKQNVEQLAPLFDLAVKMAPEEEAELVKKTSEQTKAFVASMGPHVALGMRATSGDLELTVVLQPPDPKRFTELLAAYLDLLVEQGELEKVLSEGVVMDDADVHRFELVKPPPRFPEGAFIAYAIAGDKVVLALSTDWEGLRTTLRTAKRGTGAAAKHVSRILAEGDPQASLLFYCDVRALLQGIDSFQVKPSLKIRAGDPVPFWILATTDGRTRTFAFRADAVGLAEIFEMLR